MAKELLSKTPFYKNEYFLLSLIVALGVALRIFHLSTESIWLDEGISILLSRQDLAHIIQSAANDVHPPLYYIVLHYWILIFSDSETCARALSVLLSALSIVFTYKIARTLFNKPTALLSAGLLSISVFHIREAQESRMYTLLLLLSLLSFHLAQKALQHKKNSTLLLFVLCNSALLYTHLFGFFTIAAQSLYLLYLYASKNIGALEFRKGAGIFVLILASFSPWISILLQQMQYFKSAHHIAQPGILEPFYALYSFAGSKILFTAFTLLAIKGAWMTIKQKKEFYFLGLWLLCPLLLPIFISQFSSSIFLHKYAIVASVPYFIFAAKGIADVHNKFSKASAIALVIFCSAAALKNYYFTTKKEEWRQVYQHLSNHVKNGETIVFHAKYVKKNAFDYYAKKDQFNELVFPLTDKDIDSNNISELKNIIQEKKKIWLVISHAHDDHHLLQKEIIARYKIKEHSTFIGIELYRIENTEN